MPTVQTSTPIPQQPPTVAPSENNPTECILTITNPLVALRSQPGWPNPELAKIKPGQYTALNRMVVPFAGVNEGWFQIEAEGRKGWIPDNTIMIDSKTTACDTM
jgi:hypothetical protein